MAGGATAAIAVEIRKLLIEKFLTSTGVAESLRRIGESARGKGEERQDGEN
jgi:hypothetical protein